MPRFSLTPSKESLWNSRCKQRKIPKKPKTHKMRTRVIQTIIPSIHKTWKIRWIFTHLFTIFNDFYIVVVIFIRPSKGTNMRIALHKTTEEGTLVIALNWIEKRSTALRFMFYSFLVIIILFSCPLEYLAHTLLQTIEHWLWTQTHIFCNLCSKHFVYAHLKCKSNNNKTKNKNIQRNGVNMLWCETYSCMWNHNIAGAIMAFLPNFIKPILWLWIVC